MFWEAGLTGSRLEFGGIGGMIEGKSTGDGGMNFSGTDLAICFAVGVLLSLGLVAVGKIYFYRKGAKEKQMAIKKAQDLIDKAMEGTDDPNEMARFVP
jgi:hypothetical protein